MVEYAKAAQPLIQKPLLVICCPRSGSTSCTKLINDHMGLSVGHEEMGVDGIVYCHWAVPRLASAPSLELETIQRQDYEFVRVVHLVRSPLSTIDSLRREMSAHYWTWQELHTGIVMDIEDGDRPTHEQVAAYWCRWYDICEIQSSETWAIETLSADHKVKMNAGIREPLPLWYEDLGSMQEQVEVRARENGYL